MNTPTIIFGSTGHTVPTIILTTAPPQSQIPQSGSRVADPGVDSLSSPSHLSSLSPIFSPRPSSISEVSDGGISSYNSSAADLSIVGEECGARSTVYHIYHAGNRNANFTAHNIKDTELIGQLHEEAGPVVLDRGCGGCNWLAHGVRALEALPPPKRIKPDDNKTDPRKATYYLHSPLLRFHQPPQTLRYGGDKNAPVVCLIEGSFFWRTWRLGFVVPEGEDGKKGKKGSKDKDQKTPEVDRRADSGFSEGEYETADCINQETKRRWRGLNEPGVIDPRGVLVSKYPLRASGHRFGETGKEYAREEKAKRQKSSSITPEQVVRRMGQSNSFSKRARELFCPHGSSLHSVTATPPPTPEPWLSEEALPAEPDTQDLPDHLKPDSLEEGSVLMKWSGWLTREYEFVYRGVSLRWKGTGTVKDEKKYLGLWSRYNHLKLVAILSEEEEAAEAGEVEQRNERLQVNPRELGRRGSFSSLVSLVCRRDSGVSVAESGDGSKPKGGRQVVIAKYTCLAATRKAGRLTVYEHGLEQVTSVHVKSGRENEFNTEKERLKHLTVATAFCMLQAEKEKRDSVLKIIETLVIEGSGGT